MLSAYGDPCDGVEHPAFQSEARKTIVDGVQEYQGVDTDIIYAVEKVAVKDGWAYIETGPLTGAGSGENQAYLLEINDLQARSPEWIGRWEGPPGATAESPKGNPYPEGFDSSAQDILRCQTSCSVGG